jgi:WD40 repeat protein
MLAPARDGRALAVGRGGRIFLWRSDVPDRLSPLSIPPSLATAARPRERDGDREGDRFGRFRLPLSWVALALAPAADRLYLIDNEFNLHAWALDGLHARDLRWADRPSRVTCLALSPDGSLLAVGGRTGAVTLLDTATGAAHAQFRPAAEGAADAVSALAFDPAGKELAVGTFQGKVALWSVAKTLAPLLHLPGGGQLGAVTALAFDARARRLALSFDTFSPGLATAGGDRTVDVWNLERLREELARLSLTW